MPVEWPADPELEWCPPGHGDLYTALVTSGMLEALLDRGYEYAFVSNSDNLGAVLDPRILAWFAAEGVPFLMEVADRTEADRKGGHLARRRDGGSSCCARSPRHPTRTATPSRTSRATATSTPTRCGSTCPPSPTRSRERDDVLGLPMIVNRKTVDPADPSSPAVYQLETAMGAAIAVFDGARGDARAARALRAGQDDQRPARAALGRLRADRGRPRRARAASGGRPPLVDLDPDYFKLVARLRGALPGGAAVAGGVRAPRRRGRRRVRRGRRRARRGGGRARRRGSCGSRTGRSSRAD